MVDCIIEPSLDELLDSIAPEVEKPKRPAKVFMRMIAVDGQKFQKRRGANRPVRIL